MKVNLYCYVFLILSQFLPVIAKGNETFLETIQKDNIINHSSKEYLGGLQIWCIEQSKNKDIFLATNKGVSVYDGHTWHNYKGANYITYRWLCYDTNDDVMYSAGDNEFGYWQRDDFGQYVYTLLYKNDNPLFSEIFWRVYSLGDTFFFQTQQKIYSYNKHTNSITTILSAPQIQYLYKFKEELYAQIDNELYKYSETKFEPTGLIVNSRIVDIVSIKEHMYLITEDLGVLEVKDMQLTEKQIAANKIITKTRPFSACQLSPNTIAIGSVLDGAFVLNDRLEIQNHFNFQQGLNHTTVLSMKLDTDSTLWLGLDGGLAEIKDHPTEIVLTTSKADIGSVYDAVWFRNHLYLGTNKGLFLFENDRHNNVRFIEGSQGQIWDIIKVDDDILIVCHDRGLFQLDLKSNRLTQIESGRLWNLVPFDNNPNIFLGLDMDQFFSIYEKKNNTIVFKHRIENLNAANTRAQIDRYGHIWVQDRHNKPVRVQLDNNFQLEKVKAYPSLNATDSISLTKIDGDIVFYDRKNAYTYDIAIDSIVRNQHYTEFIREMQFVPREIIQTDKDIFFYASADQIAYIKRNGNKFYNYGQIFQSIGDFELTSFAHKVIPISNGIVSSGIQGGVALYFLKNQEAIYKSDLKLEIAQIELHNDKQTELLTLSNIIVHKLPSTYSNLRIYFTNLYPNNLVEYKIGDEGKWTAVRAMPYLDIPKMPYGSHTLYFRNIDIYNTNTPAQCLVHIYVERPWYLSAYAIIFGILILVIISLAIRFLFKKRLKQQREKIIKEQIQILEKEKKEFDLEILQMRLKEEEKKMLSLTMESMKYNEILNELKGYALNYTNGSKDNTQLINKLKGVANIIDSHLKKEDPNKVFERYFNTIHDGFYDRLSRKHPGLTQSEMKLCAYIKLNLNTKEIATHINIAPSSVEVARYRLRKKLDLDSDTNLQEYISRI